jgi:hypothetical protein
MPIVGPSQSPEKGLRFDSMIPFAPKCANSSSKSIRMLITAGPHCGSVHCGVVGSTVLQSSRVAGFVSFQTGPLTDISSAICSQ